MPSGTRKMTPWVQVPRLKMRNMCGLCGHRGMRTKTVPVGALDRGHFERWCTVTNKTCQASARHCVGPYVMEHKVEKLVRLYVDEEENS